MQIQQAIFTSSDRSQIKGYQLVAKSADIDRNIAQELHRWSPSHLGNDDPASWTINYFPVSEDVVAVTRTVVGGPEYSSRGGSQVVTLIAVLQNEQFAAYQNNALAVAQTAMALGWMRLPSDMPGRSLATFELPDSPFVGDLENQEPFEQQPPENIRSWHRPESNHSHHGPDDSLLAEIAELLSQKRRFAILGARDPTKMLAKLISCMSIQKRREFSFTTGLPPALHRPFQAHFLPRSNPSLSQMLKSEGIALIQVPQTVAQEW